VDSLASKEEEDVAFKESAFNIAFTAVEGIESISDAAEYYFLLDQRLTRTSYARIRNENLAKISLRVSELVARDLNAVLIATRRFFTSMSDNLHPAFSKGMILGLSKLASIPSNSLFVLFQYPDVAKYAISTEPKIALGCLIAIQNPNVKASLLNEIVDLIRSIEDESTRGRLLDALLPKALGAKIIPVLDELLREFPNNAMPRVLELMEMNSELLSDEDIFRIIQERLSVKYSIDIVEWSYRVTHWSKGIAKFLSVCFKFNKDGMSLLLTTFNRWSSRDIEIISLFLQRGSYNPLPKWLREYCDTNPEFLVSILHLKVETLERYFSPFIHAYLNQIQHLHLSHWTELASKIAGLRNLEFSNRLLDLLIKDAISVYLEKENNRNIWLAWEATHPVEEWLNQVSIYQLESFFANNTSSNEQAWIRSWSWLADVNSCFFTRGSKVLNNLIDTLTSITQHQWKKSVVTKWKKIIQRASRECDDSTHLSLCVQALGFCFAHPSYPLSELMVEVFLPVYNAVSHPRPRIETDILFNILDWDKAKELRKELVKCFMASDWPPGDLALAVQEERLLRKIFKRVMRRASGPDYIDKMINDLRDRDVKVVKSVLDILLDLSKNPNFFEEWD
jgi:hypothetical protein